MAPLAGPSSDAPKGCPPTSQQGTGSSFGLGPQQGRAGGSSLTSMFPSLSKSIKIFKEKPTNKKQQDSAGPPSGRTRLKVKRPKESGAAVSVSGTHGKPKPAATDKGHVNAKGGSSSRVTAIVNICAPSRSDRRTRQYGNSEDFNAPLQQRTRHPDRKSTRKTALELHVRPNGPTDIGRAFHPAAAAHASEGHTEHPPGRVTC